MALTKYQQLVILRLQVQVLPGPPITLYKFYLLVYYLT